MSIKKQELQLRAIHNGQSIAEINNLSYLDLSCFWIRFFIKYCLIKNSKTNSGFKQQVCDSFLEYAWIRSNSICNTGRVIDI